MNNHTNITEAASDATASRSINNKARDTLDALCDVKDYLEALFMALSAIGDSHQCNALQRVTLATQDTLETATANLHQIHEETIDRM